MVLPGYRFWLIVGAALFAFAVHPWVLAWIMVGDPDMPQRRAWADTVLRRHTTLPAVDLSGRPVTIPYLDIARAVPGPCSRRTDFWEIETKRRRSMLDVFAPRVTHACRYRTVDASGAQAHVAIRIERFPYAPPPGSFQQPYLVKAEELPETLALISAGGDGREDEACAHVPSLHPGHPAFHRAPPVRDIWNEPSRASEPPRSPPRDECRP